MKLQYLENIFILFINRKKVLICLSKERLLFILLKTM